MTGKAATERLLIIRLSNGRLAVNADGRPRVWFDRERAELVARVLGGTVEEVR